MSKNATPKAKQRINVQAIRLTLQQIKLAIQSIESQLPIEEPLPNPFSVRQQTVANDPFAVPSEEPENCEPASAFLDDEPAYRPFQRTLTPAMDSLTIQNSDATVSSGPTWSGASYSRSRPAGLERFGASPDLFLGPHRSISPSAFERTPTPAFE